MCLGYSTIHRFSRTCVTYCRWKWWKDGDKAIGWSSYPLTRAECRRGKWPKLLLPTFLQPISLQPRYEPYVQSIQWEMKLLIKHVGESLWIKVISIVNHLVCIQACYIFVLVLDELDTHIELTYMVAKYYEPCSTRRGLVGCSMAWSKVIFLIMHSTTASSI